MPELPNTVGDREYQKFVADANGNTSVRIAPGAVTDSEGHELDIDEVGRARMLDTKANDKLSCIQNTLEEILIQLQLISGA